jgi:uncharacterized protein YjeT (DUF2065 family)
MADLWAALCLVLVIEGLLLFAVPAAWKSAIAQLLTLPDRRLRAVGGAMVVAGLVSLYLLRAT